MNGSTVLPDPQPHLNADQLEQTIAVKRARLAELATDEQRTRRSLALDHMAAYAELLREAANAGTCCLIASHDVGLATHLDRAFLMADGRIRPS